MLMKSNISDDSLKLLNELSEGCSCVANKPDLVHEICLRKVMKNTDNSNLSTINGKLKLQKSFHFCMFLFLGELNVFYYCRWH